MKHQTGITFWKRAASFLLCLFVIAAWLLPLSAQAQPTDKVVRVGWYDSSFNTVSETGRRSGYAYEYQLRISSYTGWRYEYVSGSWSDLLQMLEAGEIDLMSDVSYTPERAERMLFASFPMGAEEYYLFVATNNSTVTPTDYSTLNGKCVGVNKDSVQADYYREWARRNGVDAELIELTTTEDESLRMLRTGEIDAYVTVDSFTTPERALPVCKVGASDFFFAVSKSRPDLLRELDSAISRIRDEDRYYNQRLFEKYFKRTGANAFLSGDEVDWLSQHGAIRVGYQDNYLAFCASDEETGELTGALKDYLTYASGAFANARLAFAPMAYPTASAAMDALKRGEVDCVFPANIGAYDAETLGIILTPSVMSTDIYAVARASERATFARKEHVVVAVNEGDLNYDAILIDHFPEWRKVYFPSVEERLHAVSEGLADCVLISNYRFNNIARLCEKYHLIALSTRAEVDYCFAVNKGETELHTILAKTVGLVPSSKVNAAMAYYITEDAKLSVADLLRDNLPIVGGVTAAVLALFFVLMIRSMRAERKAKKLISATESDALTGLYNRDYFFQYANHMFAEHPSLPMDAIVVNIEQFHSVNALNGREFGDQVLRELGGELYDVALENRGIAGRFGADRFDLYCRHIEDYQAVFDRLQSRLNELSQNTNIRLRMGVMPWQEKVEPVQMFDRARTACNMARGHYKKHLIVYDETIRERETREQRLQNDLRRALDSYELEVYYQPKFDIQSDPPRFVSAEALVRWQHPEFGLVMPADFIPAFERSGQISSVDKYVWEEAARQIARWREQYGVTIPVSVNLSRVDVFDPTLEETLERILQYNGLDRESFKLEVTESAYTENSDQVVRVVEHLRDMGYQVEMDDFGAGYSSLNMLSDMPIDFLKMDRAFVRNIDHSEKTLHLVELILGIAKSLNIPVVAEGVETREQLRLLRELGCAMVQGYYFSRPLQSSDFEVQYVRDMQSAE